MVLADGGVVCIDEFDKMRPQDRVAIHEAMEQQSISISKAGIVATLQARCAVIAAANPIRGRYDSSLTFAENVELTDPILSRFDILCVVRDIVDPIMDHQLALHVVQSHIKSHPQYSEEDLQNPVSIIYNPNELIPQDLLRKYIRYARQNIKPKLADLDRDKISRLYVELREQAAKTGGVPIAVRHIESIMRIAEAHAKLHLRSVVRSDDVDMAIRVMLDSFIGTQKFQIQNQLRKRFQRYLTFRRDNNELLYFLLKGLALESLQAAVFASKGDIDEEMRLEDQPSIPVEITLRDFLERAKDYGIHNVGNFFQSPVFQDSGFCFVQSAGIIRRETSTV